MRRDPFDGTGRAPPVVQMPHGVIDRFGFIARADGVGQARGDALLAGQISRHMRILLQGFFQDAGARLELSSCRKASSA